MTQDFKKQFGLKVKHYRQLIGYSQEKLAEKVGISTNTVSYIERGKNTISFTKLPALCTALEIEPFKLFMDTENNDDKIQSINKILSTATEKQLNVTFNIIKNIFDFG